MSHFIGKVYMWFRQHQRVLPWRLTSDPYQIWVSEIILQQTRVAQGLPYYENFIRHFPDLGALAAASEDELLKVWEGLGYYSRARNMHQAAQTIVSQYHGAFPDTYEAIRALKGIGEYTAAAIASISFGLPYAVVDGNVFRVLTRYLGITEPVDTARGKVIVRQTATGLLNPGNPGFHNQAMMEFGALCCIPRNPDCFNCPVHQGCYAFEKGMTNSLPVKNRKISRKVRYFYFYIPEDADAVLIEKRTGHDIWKNLYQFPLFEAEHELNETEILTNPFFDELISGYSGATVEISRIYTHELTHRQIRARFIRIKRELPGMISRSRMVVHKKEIHKFAFPVLIRKFIEEKMLT